MRIFIYIRKKIFVIRAVIFAYYTRYKLLHTRYYKQKHIQTQKSIVYINTSNTQGGAARIAHDLHVHQNLLKQQSQMLVSNKQGTEAAIYELKQDASKKQQLLFEAQKWLQWQDFFHLASIELHKHPLIQKSSIVHLHNLHSWNGYFSPFALPKLSSCKQIIWTLHDMHAVTGHCAYSFKCEKWKIGCGNCPQLETYPKLTKDTTAFIWKTKKNIYKKCDMHIVVPSKWLQDIVSKSILKHLPCTLIYNGIDTTIFKQSTKQEIRKKYLIPDHTFVVLFSADNGFKNPYKGGEYVKKIIKLYTNANNLLFINIGGGQELIKNKNSWTLPHKNNKYELAEWYSCSDMYLYPSLADNCPLGVLEAMSCGLPIVTFNTGGIPELVLHKETGYIAKHKDFNDLCAGFEYIYRNPNIRESMSQLSIARVHEHFTQEIMIKKYVDLYNTFEQK